MFDIVFYSDLYPDVSLSTAQSHWNNIGMNAGRFGSRQQFYNKYPDFRWADYIKMHPQTRQMACDNWETRAMRHFILNKSKTVDVVKEHLIEPVVPEITIEHMVGFNWQYYIEKYPDLKMSGIDNQADAISHWMSFGRREGRSGVPESFIFEDAIPKQIKQGKTVGVFVTLFYDHLQNTLLKYLMRLPFTASIYVASDLDISDFKSNLEELGHTLIHLPATDFGMDIGDFISQLKHIKDNNISHDYYLKIHTKKANGWREHMLCNVLPTHHYQILFDNIDETHFTYPGMYAYPIGNSLVNKSLILAHMSRHEIEIPDLYTEVDVNNHAFSVKDYYHYNSDLKSLTRWLLNTCQYDRWQKDLLTHHNQFDEEGNRIITKPIHEGNPHYRFSAGTMFWFDQTYLDYFHRHSDDLDLMVSNLSNETGGLINDTPTYTHMLEYWFGLIASHMNHKPIRTLKTINFILPPLGDGLASSGGFRTLMRQIASLQNHGYFVTIQVCHCDQSKLNDQKTYIMAYKLIPHMERIRITSETENVLADVHVATGWQTFGKAIQYEQLAQHVCFFCQDLEWLFPAVKLQSEHAQKEIRNFYNHARPTFTMSKFLHEKLKTFHPGKITSTTLNVDHYMYNIKNKSKRKGVCILHSSAKKHRLPHVTIELINRISNDYKDTPIYIFGDILESDRRKMGTKNTAKNINVLGSLPVEELPALYNKCKIGVCMSTTNPSRVGLEMSACGCVCVEAMCEYTQYDLDQNMFLLCEPDIESVYNGVERLLTSSKLYNKKYEACVSYSNNLHNQITEEALFMDMIDEVFYK